MRSWAVVHRWLIALAVVLPGCPTNPPGDAPGDTYSTGTVCPPTSTLTYETFGSTFFSTYCIRCHSITNVTEAMRNGAPMDVNFDSHELVIPLGRRIDRMAAIGPVSANRLMPPDDGIAPSDEERRQLGEWIACGLP